MHNFFYIFNFFAQNKDWLNIETKIIMHIKLINTNYFFYFQQVDL